MTLEIKREEYGFTIRASSDCGFLYTPAVVSEAVVREVLVDLVDWSADTSLTRSVSRADAILKECYGSGIIPSETHPFGNAFSKSRWGKLTRDEIFKQLNSDGDADEKVWALVPDYYIVWADRELQDRLREEVTDCEYWSEQVVTVKVSPHTAAVLEELRTKLSRRFRLFTRTPAETV